MEGVRIIVSSPVCTVQAARTNGVTPFFLRWGHAANSTVQYTTCVELVAAAHSSGALVNSRARATFRLCVEKQPSLGFFRRERVAVFPVAG
jgi:hypothetical protein